MGLGLWATKWHHKPWVSLRINQVSNPAALSHLWQCLIPQMHQLKAKCLVAKQGPLQCEWQRMELFLRVHPHHLFVLVTPEAAQWVEEHSTTDRGGNVSCHCQYLGFVSLLACTGNRELYFSLIGSWFILYLQWPRLPVYNLPAKLLKLCSLPEEDFGNQLAGTNCTAPSVLASSDASVSCKTRENNTAVMSLKFRIHNKTTKNK